MTIAVSALVCIFDWLKREVCYAWALTSEISENYTPGGVFYDVTTHQKPGNVIAMAIQVQHMKM